MKYIVIMVLIVVGIGFGYPFFNEYFESHRMVSADAKRMEIIQKAMLSYSWDVNSFKNRESIIDAIVGNTDWKVSEGAGCSECNPGPYYDIIPNPGFTDFEIVTNNKVRYPWHATIRIDNNGKIHIK